VLLGTIFAFIPQLKKPSQGIFPDLSKKNWHNEGRKNLGKGNYMRIYVQELASNMVRHLVHLRDIPQLYSAKRPRLPYIQPGACEDIIHIILIISK
jgi:hypothetical protein